MLPNWMACLLECLKWRHIWFPALAGWLRRRCWTLCLLLLIELRYAMSLFWAFLTYCASLFLTIPNRHESAFGKTRTSLHCWRELLWLVQLWHHHQNSYLECLRTSWGQSRVIFFIFYISCSRRSLAFFFFFVAGTQAHLGSIAPPCFVKCVTLPEKNSCGCSHHFIYLFKSPPSPLPPSFPHECAGYYLKWPCTVYGSYHRNRMSLAQLTVLCSAWLETLLRQRQFPRPCQQVECFLFCVKGRKKKKQKTCWLLM